MNKQASYRINSYTQYISTRYSELISSLGIYIYMILYYNVFSHFNVTINVRSSYICRLTN